MIGFSNAVFASNKSHAHAMIWWLGLEPGIWHANTYGAKLRDRYDRAILIRPIDGITQEHFVWITILLAPRMTSVEHITPLHWQYDDFPREGDLRDQICFDPYGFR